MTKIIMSLGMWLCKGLMVTNKSKTKENIEKNNETDNNKKKEK